MNMSYCRYVNTYTDLVDCFEALQEEQFTNDELSESETKYRDSLIEKCVEISLNFGGTIGKPCRLENE